MIFDKRELIKAIIGSDFFGLILLTIVMAVSLSYRDSTYEHETVPVVIKDAIVEPAAVLKGFYLPEKYYLALEYNDKYIWTIPGKEAYEKYKDKVGGTIEADVEVRSGFCVLLYKLEGQTIPGTRKGETFESQPIF